MTAIDSGENFFGNQGSLWVQPHGPNTIPRWLGCHEVAAVTVPRGDVTRRHCVDRYGNFYVKMRAQGPGGEVTSSILTYSAKTADWLETHGDCRMPVYIHQGECGARDLFASYERGQILAWAIITNNGETNLVMRETAEAAEISWDISAKYRKKYWPLVLTPLVTANAGVGNKIVASHAARCWGGCGSALDSCETLFVCNDVVAAGVANIDVTVNGGTTWAAQVGPFIATENIISGVAFPIATDVWRWVVVRDTAAGVLQVGYSDDLGVTWDLVVLPGAAAEAAAWGGCMFALDRQHIWLGTDDFNIYFSGDGALTWALQDVVGTAVNCIHFIDEKYGLSVGVQNDVEYTEDGGVHWTPVVGPSAADDLLSCAVIDKNHWWIGNDDGELWYTNNQGANWYQRFFDLPPGVVAILAMGLNDMDWIDEFCGHFVIRCTIGGANHGLIYRTVDGGYTWQHEVSGVFTAAETYNSIVACDYNKAYTAGGLTAGVTTIDTVAP